MPLPPWAVRAGARETIYFDPSKVNAAIVTCGGLCPGLNDVVQVSRPQILWLRVEGSGLGFKTLVLGSFAIIVLAGSAAWAFVTWPMWQCYMLQASQPVLDRNDSIPRGENAFCH